jgi:flagellar hook assembly protein FlgD
MRFGSLILASLSMAAAGSACLPLVDLDQRVPEQGAKLAISIERPSRDTTVPVGTKLEIAWSAANLTGNSATVAIFVESRSEPLLRSTIATDVAVSGTSQNGSVLWDTTGFSGPYAIIAEIRAGDQTDTMTSEARVSVQGPPAFHFISPDSDVDYEPGTTLTIEYNGGGPGASVEFALDPDSEHESGNELNIFDDDLPDPAADDSFEWDGQSETDEGDSDVPTGTYRLFARVNDGVSPEQIVEAAGRITVLDATTVGLRIIVPSEDTEFLTGGDPLVIEYGLDKTEDVLIDLKIDPDDSQANGNETAILSQKFVSKDTPSESFVWDGTSAAGTPVPDGIYKIVIVASTGGGTPGIAVGSALIFRRSVAQQPLIALLTPSAPTALRAGDFLSIKWRDDDPATTSTIRLTIDDDPNPDESDPPAETEDPEIEILTGRGADPDGVQDTFSYQIPNTLAPGTYYVFAYIDQTGDGTPEHHSVSPGTLIIKDPENP